MLHLAITNGPQHRDFILETTLQICTPYFDSIRIFQNGGHAHGFLINKYTIEKSHTFKDFLYCQNVLKEGVNEGDWIFALDSDERPSPALLKMLAEYTSGLHNTVTFPFKHHAFANDGKIISVCGEINGFRSARMFRVAPDLEATVAWSAHFGYRHKSPLEYYSPHFINHYKHEFATYLSSLTFGVSLPDSIGVTPDMPEFSLLERVKDVFESYFSEQCTPASIYQNYAARIFWTSLRHLAVELKSYPRTVNVGIGIDFLSKNTQDLLILHTHQDCLLDCCNYVQNL